MIKIDIFLPKFSEKIKDSVVLKHYVSTVWKFQDFSVIQILLEINFGESMSSEIVDFACQ